MERETADDQLIVEIASLARDFAMNIVDDDPAEDIAQDVALQCLMKIRAGKWRVEAAALRDFVRRVVRRKAVDLLRRSQAREQRHAEYALEAHAAQTWMSPELAYEERELAEFREQALGRLPALCRRTYLLVREEEETYRNAALRLGVRPTTVSAHIVTAQQRLRNELAERGISEAPRRSRRARRRRRSSPNTARKTVEG